MQLDLAQLLGDSGGIFAVVYAFRKYAPLWLRKLAPEERWQWAIPFAIAACMAGWEAYRGGASWQLAAKAGLSAALSIAIHKILKDMPGGYNGGKLGGARPLGALAGLTLLALSCVPQVRSPSARLLEASCIAQAREYKLQRVQAECSVSGYDACPTRKQITDTSEEMVTKCLQ